jgi:hypothetical protein
MFGLAMLLRHILPDTALATFTYILVSYHLILAFKVFTSDKKARLSLPIGQAILTHAACIGVLVSLAVLRHQIPFFGLIRYFLPGIAPFEARWLFSGEQAKIERLTDGEAIQAATVHVEPSPDGSVAVPAAPVSLYHSSTGEDFNEFLTLMQQGKRPFRKPGITVRQEYELWLAHRAKSLNPDAPKKPSGLLSFLQVNRNLD